MKLSRNIKKGKIDNYFSPFKHSKAQKLYVEDYIIDLTSKYEDRENVLQGIVASETYGEYLVKIRVDEEENMTFYSCSCDDFDGKGKPCEHIGACYLKYINEMKTGPSELDELLNLYEEEESSVHGSDILKLEISMGHTSSRAINNFIEVKAGVDKLYAVKNFRYFLNAYVRKEPTQLGRYILDFAKVSIIKEDEMLLDYFLELLDMDNIFLSAQGTAVRLVEDKRIFIMESHFRRVMELLKNRNITLSIPTGDYEDVHVKEEELSINFALRRDGDELMLTFQGSSIPFPMTSKGDYYFYKDGIWRVKKNKESYLIALFDTMIKNPYGALKIREDEKDRFASFLMPKVKELGNLNIEESVKKEFVEEPLSAEFYIDKDMDVLLLSPYFYYGDEKINVLKKVNKKNIHGILIRDVEKEKNILDIIREYGFETIDDKFVLQEEDTIVDFIIDGINKLKKHGDVYYSEAFKGSKIATTKNVKIRVRLTREDMLALSFDFKNIPREEIINLIKAFNEGKKYYKLKDNGIVLLQGSALIKIQALNEFQSIDDDYFEKEEIMLPKYLAPYINEKFMDEGDFKRDKGFRELINNIREAKDMDFEIPKTIKAELRDYQVKGFQWMKTLSQCGFGGILADEMGLGKTLQSITFISSLEEGASLIVCPTSLLYNWKEEFEKFAPSLKILVMSGGPNERQENFEKLQDYDVVITSYNILTRDIESYEKINFTAIIVDEGQNMKNPLSQRAKAMKRLNGRNKFVLTGTPIENALTELWSIFDFVMPGYILNRKKFQMKYEIPIVKDENPKALQELRCRIMPFILRRLKKDVAGELPPKIEKTIKVDMTPEQKDVYVTYVKMFKEEIENIDLDDFNKGKMKIFSALTRLRQICCHPNSFLMDYNGDSGKFEAFYDILGSSIEEGHKILVFSQFTSVLSIIEKEFRKQHIAYSYLDGSVPSEQRMKLVKEFNSGDNKVFLISLKAGGAGLNLTSADVVIHFDPWWNPAVEDQATDRAHRIGQKNTVEVIKLITKGTIEEKVLMLQEKKKQIIRDVIGEEEIGDKILSSMNFEDLQELFTLE